MLLELRKIKNKNLIKYRKDIKDILIFTLYFKVKVYIRYYLL